MFRLPVVCVLAAALALPCFAWNDKGHMIIAYIAYQKLSRNTRARVDELLVFHPMYAKWTEGVKIGQKGMIAFIYAATWPDCIKSASKCPGYVADGTDYGNTPPVGQEAWQNIGYADKFMHKYWHFIDLPFNTDDATGPPPKQPNLQTQVLLMAEAISENTDDAIKSYDVVWLEHLVGDMHQPLHCISRYTRNHPEGDQGGNAVRFCAAPCHDNLHAYWDDLMGSEEDIDAAIREGKVLAKVPSTEGPEDVNVPKWVNENFELAKKVAYAAPISDDNDPAQPLSPPPDASYAEAAEKTARTQVVLAGNRLALLLNRDLK